MSNEKPEELTEALFGIIFGHQRIPTYDGTAGQRCTGCDSLKGETDGPNSPRQARHLADLIVAAGWVSPEEVAAREADARREALQEAERLQTLLNSMDHFAEVAERCEAKSNEYAAKIARVEALADAAEATAVGPPFVFTRDLRAALAEPERDKESGR